MEPKSVEREEFTVVGIPVKVSLSDKGYKEKIKAVWGQLMLKLSEIKNRKGEEFYGPCNVSKGIEGDPCSFETLAAVAVKSAEDVPEGMVAWKVPARKYLVWTHEGKPDDVGKTYKVIEEWFKKSDLTEEKEGVWFELYDERYKENSEESKNDIYVPLK